MWLGLAWKKCAKLPRVDDPGIGGVDTIERRSRRENIVDRPPAGASLTAMSYQAVLLDVVLFYVGQTLCHHRAS